MDKQLKKVEKSLKSDVKDVKHIEKMDKKRDKACDMGKKMMSKAKENKGRG